MWKLWWILNIGGFGFNPFPPSRKMCDRWAPGVHFVWTDDSISWESKLSLFDWHAFWKGTCFRFFKNAVFSLVSWQIWSKLFRDCNRDILQNSKKRSKRALSLLRLLSYHSDAVLRLESMPKCYIMSRRPLDMVSREKLGVQGKISSRGGFVFYFRVWGFSRR